MTTTSPITLATWPAPPAATPAERLAQVDRIMARRAMDAHAQAVAEIFNAKLGGWFLIADAPDPDAELLDAIAEATAETAPAVLNLIRGDEA